LQDERSDLPMELKRLALSVVFAAVVLAQGSGVGVQDQRAPSVRRLPNQDRAPAFSSPPERMAPNGDRVSPYPPYYHPENSGGRH
jgi:hypothetical protein